MPKDPVCGMDVDEKLGVKSRFGGRDFFFCCPHCKSRFESDPEKFAKLS
ncbi:MAG: YHS domain-containing protein [Thermoproteota archaeon]|jgi:YHS domain-containing protein|nr:YHS domain-containing protein [Candidatus Nitrosotenuis sp.]